MGNDIFVVPIPHRELQDWWNGMTESNQDYVRERIGFLIDLIFIKHQVSLIQALAQFWEPSTASFVMNGNELTPTLEEYQVAIGVRSRGRLVQPPVGREPLSIIAEYLDLKADRIEWMMKRNTGKIPLQFLIDRYADKPREVGNMSAQVFILAFFGFVLFPCSKTAMDPIVACIARQACLKWDFSNMMLAETVMSLNLYQRNQEEGLTQNRRKKPKTVFKGSTGMLYMWFIGHIKRYRLHTRVVEVDASTHPLGRFRMTHHEVPSFDFYRWANLIGQLTPDQIRWRISWPKFHQARLSSSEGDLVPLLGFNGGTAYCPLRVIRQYGMLQEVPPVWSPESFEFELKHYAMEDQEKANYQAKVDKIVRALKSPRQDVTWPEVLEGEMELYLASEEYIAYFKAQRILNDELEVPLQEGVTNDVQATDEIITEMEPNSSLLTDPADEYQDWVEYSEELEDEDHSLITKKSKLG